VEERAYRQSRLCRVLGNPLAYSIVNLLAENKDVTPSQIARGVGKSVSRVSHVLAALRMMEVVRYETNGKQASYRLKLRDRFGRCSPHWSTSSTRLLLRGDICAFAQLSKRDKLPLGEKLG